MQPMGQHRNEGKQIGATIPQNGSINYPADKLINHSPASSPMTAADSARGTDGCA
jgi:hypothetical protein